MGFNFNKMTLGGENNSGGSGGGDKVLAINSTGSTISQSDKVWLNKHNIPSVTGDSYASYSSNKNTCFFTIGNVLYENATGTLKQWSFSNGSWSSETLQSGIFTAYNPYFVGTELVLRNPDTSNPSLYLKDVIVNPSGVSQSTPSPSFYIGNDRCLKWTANKNFSIVEFDHTTGTEGSVLGTFTTAYNFAHNIMIEGNILMLATNGSNSTATHLEYFDISNLSSITSVADITLPENSYYFYYGTGLGVGDYLFFQSTNSTTGSINTSMTLKAYKIGTNYAISVPTDLPLQLENLLNNLAVVRYDSRTKYLCVGTHDNVYFFEFNTTAKTFSQIDLTITMPTDSAIYSGCCYVPTLSGDKTTAVVVYRRDSSSVYPTRKIYKLVNSEDSNWYAEPYENFSINTLTGFATGNTSDGKYEVSTVLPPVVPEPEVQKGSFANQVLTLNNDYILGKIGEVVAWQGGPDEAFAGLLGDDNLEINTANNTEIEGFDFPLNAVTPEGFPMISTISEAGTYSLVAFAGDGLSILTKTNPS